jgi:fumarate hydratase class II
VSEHIEHDSLGEARVPDDVYYGIQTQRAASIFRVSGRTIPTRLVHALGLVKWAAAQANASLGLLEPKLADPIAVAAEEVFAGRFDSQFIVDVFQTGSGTSSNMNTNEVIAKRANELLTGRRHANHPVHPNDHVNLGQSSNDAFPTAIHLAALIAIDAALIPALDDLHSTLTAKAAEFDDVIKIGRTHLQDATPIRLGQEFSSYARMVERGRQRLVEVRGELQEVALGGTAVGTGINAHPDFADGTLRFINDKTGLSLRSAKNPFEALSSRHAVVWTSSALKTLAVDLMKIANDLRLLASGPRCGLGEITLPALQPGSSIMPGKVNPVAPETVCQVAAQVIGNDATITVAGQSGLLELNVMMPVMADNLLESIDLLSNVCGIFSRHCIAGIDANRERCRQYVEYSSALVTALSPHIGYDRAAELARMAHEEGLTVREIAARELELVEEELESLLDADGLTRGNHAR